MRTIGLSYQTDNCYDKYNLFVNREFMWDSKFDPSYPTSELLFLGGGSLLNGAVSSDDTFDIRGLGLVHAITFLLVTALLVLYARSLTAWRRLLLYALVAFIFTDIGYVAYFNSLYSEPSSLIFFCAAVVFALAGIAKGQSNDRGWLFIIGYFAASALFVTAKFQNAFLGFPMAFFGWRLYGMVTPASKRLMPRFRWLGVGLVILLTLASAGFYGLYTELSAHARPANLYDTVFEEILGHSKTPEADAAALGLPVSLAKYAGTSAYSTDVPAEVKSEIVSRVGYTNVIKFYLTHPGRLWNLAGRSAASSLSMRPSYLGNLEPSAVDQDKLAGQQINPSALPDDFRSRKFSAWSTIKKNCVPKTLWFLGLFLGVNVATVVLKWRYFDKMVKDYKISELHAVLILMAVLQFFIVIIGEGEHEIVKHLFLFNLLSEICFIFLIMYMVSGVAYLWQRKTMRPRQLVIQND
ncbi:MAG: hypothetical protein ABFD64_06525 [Armatimonadota bacterium]